MIGFMVTRLLAGEHSRAGELHAGPFGPLMGSTLERSLTTPHPSIPAGTYPFRLKAIGTSRFDATAATLLPKGTYRGMPHVENVTGRSEILVHWGNFWTDSLGCILLGRNTILKDGDYQLGGGTSRTTWAACYPVFVDAILRDADCQIQFVDKDAGP